MQNPTLIPNMSDGSQPFSASASKSAATKPVVVAADLPSQLKVPKRAIAQDVLDVLRACRVEGLRVYLPSAQLERDLYRRVNDVLTAFGGEWKSGKVKAHVFQEDPAPMLAVAIDTGEFLKPSDVGFFQTPQREVDRVMALAKIEPGMSTMEPSAGRGAFALAMLKAVGNNPDLVTVCELLPSNVRALQEAGFTKVIQGDFLALEPRPIFDRIVMNPPFNGGVDIDHVMHATKFLNPTGRLTAITSVGWASNSSRKAEEFRDFVQDVDAFTDEIERGAFKASGTDVPSKILSIEAENLPWYRDSDQEPPPQPS